MHRPLSLVEFGGCGLRERLVRSSARGTKRAPTSSDSRRQYVVVVASAGIPAGFFVIGPLSRAWRRAKEPSVAIVELPPTDVMSQPGAGDTAGSDSLQIVI